MHLTISQSYNLIKNNYNRIRDAHLNRYYSYNRRVQMKQTLPVCLLESMDSSSKQTLESFNWHFVFYDLCYNRNLTIVNGERIYGEFGQL